MASWMTTLLHDFRFALRGITKRPLFSLVVVVILGLGMGATTAVVDLANLLAWRQIPARDAAELVKVYTARNRGFIGPYHAINYPDYLAYRDHAVSMSGLAAVTDLEMRLNTGESTEMLWGGAVSGNFYDVLGLVPWRGRGLTPDDDLTGAEPVAVVSHRLARRLGSDAEIVGRRVELEGQPFTVVGVAPPDFVGPTAGLVHDFLVPIASLTRLMPTGEEGVLEARGPGQFQVIGRLAAGETRESVAAELTVLAEALDREFPMEKQPRQITVGEAHITHPIDLQRLASALQLFGAAVVLLLLITCANVAHLLLSRAAARRREMAVRLSIGASRGSLIRQLLTESFVLATVAGGLGLAIARWARTFLESIAGPEFAGEMRFDVRVLGASFVVCLAVTVLFGLAPALSSTRVNLALALKDGVGDGGRRRFTAGTLLAAGQVGLCVVLLVAGTLLVQSLYHRIDADLGIDDEHLLVARLTLPEVEYPPEARARFFRQLVERARALPGVDAAGAGLLVPPLLFDINVPVTRVGEDEPATQSRVNIVDRGYFDTLGIRLLRGRLFDDSDTASDRSAERPPLVINQMLAERLWPGEDPVGRTLDLGTFRPGEAGPYFTVVGVVSNVTQHRSSFGGDPMLYYSWPYRDRPSRQIVMRTNSEIDAAAAGTVFDSLRATLRDMDPNLALTAMRTGDTNRRDAFAIEGMQAQAVAVFALCGFLLAVVGIFGVLSHRVSRRVREIGIRMAIGAQAGDVRRQVVAQGLRTAAAGAAAGLLAVLAGGRLLESLLYGVTWRDPWVLAAVLAVVFASTAVAAYLPARRASRLDPLRALRYE